jgi:hypothetical protein
MRPGCGSAALRCIAGFQTREGCDVARHADLEVGDTIPPLAGEPCATAVRITADGQRRPRLHGDGSFATAAVFGEQNPTRVRLVLLLAHGIRGSPEVNPCQGLPVSLPSVRTSMNAAPLLNSVVAALAEVRLEAVLIGNAAAAIQGAPVTTVDFDFMFRATPPNLAKLKRFAGRPRDRAVLEILEATLREKAKAR